VRRILILGAGGHAQVVADILLRMADHGEEVAVLGYLDDDPTRADQRPLDLPVLGATADLATIPHDAVIIAIGDNGTRATLFRQLQETGERFAVARHPSAVLAPDVQVGPGTMICAGAIVNPGAVIGANAILNTGCTVDHHNHIGDHVHIAPGAHLGGEVTIGEGALVGIGATVMPGRTAGAWSIAGAGALVHRDVPAGATAIGVPARIIRYPKRGD
jgi:sugar O-acyltransferase (sialic acid O-acetyltransferase NeuD family)